MRQESSSIENKYHDVHAEHRTLEAKIYELEQKRTQQKKDLDNTVAEKNKLDLQVKNIAKDLALSKDIVYKLEINEKNLHRRLDEQKQKTRSFEETLIELRSNYQTASKDLSEIREKCYQKIDY
uniref:Uncharacterized protein n=1 Tax=Ditylenchus dipsaci TaxID=166011 RepID=A0A915EJV7_9BILA